jgi:uncharacterized protein YjiS (DUF1127 family)
MGGVLALRYSALQHSAIKRPSKDAAPRTGAEQRASRKGIIMNMARSFSNWRKYRQTVNELDRMTTRELRDLGIERSEIKTVARAAVGF